jgi:hypothetical protein
MQKYLTAKKVKFTMQGIHSKMTRYAKKEGDTTCNKARNHSVKTLGSDEMTESADEDAKAIIELFNSRALLIKKVKESTAELMGDTEDIF